MLTLNEFVSNIEHQNQEEKQAFSSLLTAISLASKIIHREINAAGLNDLLGQAGNTNVQGEDQQKLDVFADEQFIKAMHVSGQIAALASEEQDDILCFEDRKEAKYLIAFDPLDGSSNIDVNIPVGTIFSIFKRTKSGKVETSEFLRKGKEQACAGYVIYGSSTMLVFTSGNEVNGFTLDTNLGEFCMSHPKISIPKNGVIYSINEGNFGLYDSGYIDYINHCKQLQTDGKRSHTGRFIGSLVADFHRNMLKGGIFLYPGTQDKPEGKLRLLYECSPIALIAELAGGLSSDGNQSVLDIDPTDIHQRIPFIVGSSEKVEKALSFLN